MLYGSFTLINVSALQIVLTMGFPFLVTKTTKLPEVSSCASRRALQGQCLSPECGPISWPILGTQSPDSDETDDARSSRQDFFQGFRRALDIFNEMWSLLREQRSPSPIPRPSPPRSPVLSRFCCDCTLSTLAT